MIKIKKSILPLTLTVFFILPATSFALRCGSDLVNLGDLKHEVLLACGEPSSKEVIGYIDQEKNGDRIRVLIIEEWIVEKTNQFYSLIFEGNKLVSIESAGEK